MLFCLGDVKRRMQKRCQRTDKYITRKTSEICDDQTSGVWCLKRCIESCLSAVAQEGEALVWKVEGLPVWSICSTWSILLLKTHRSTLGCHLALLRPTSVCQWVELSNSYCCSDSITGWLRILLTRLVKDDFRGILCMKSVVTFPNCMHVLIFFLVCIWGV